MKLIRVVAVVVAGGLLFSACGGQSDGERAQSFAIKACGFPTDDGGEPVKNEEGVVQFDASQDSSVDIMIDTDPISEIQTVYDDLVDRSASAQAASQLSSSWESLADGFAKRTGILAKFLSARKNGRNPVNDPNAAADIATYNEKLTEYLSECSGLATLLSE